MFYFIEGEYQKGPNSVCSFWYYALIDIFSQYSLVDDLTEIIIFCDATCSQNRSWTNSKFLLCLSVVLCIKIVIVYPVKGHSYCLCDRNCSILTNCLRKFHESIETPEKYIELINKKFTIVKAKVFDYENYTENYVKKSKTMKISKAVKIKFYPNGNLKMFNSYKLKCLYEENLLKPLEKGVKIKLSDAKEAPKGKIDKNKINDVLSLMNFVSEINVEFYKKYFKKFE